MKKFKKMVIVTMVMTMLASFASPLIASAATTPSLGSAATYGILSSTYTNTTAGTTINGDVGFTTGPALLPGGTHNNYGSGSPYATAGSDQANALSNINNQACTFTFAPGAIDLATDTTHGTIGVYTPGVYCTSGPGAASIGTAGIILSGIGTYIFKIDGALTSVANSAVTLQGASACDVFWAPTQATTLGADSTFVGTNIDASGITLESNVGWKGQALAFGGTVTTVVDDTITVPSCTSQTPIPGGSGTAGTISGGCLWTGPNPCSSYGPQPQKIQIAPVAIAAVPVPVATLPNTGLPPDTKNNTSSVIIISSLSAVLLITYIVRGRKIS